MAQIVLITLTIAGTNTGPFDIYSDSDGYSIPFENNVPKASLETGFISINVPDDATIIRVQSDNLICDNYIDLELGTTTTTTTESPTTTTTTTNDGPTTTSTTTQEPCLEGPYTHYLADRWDCITCEIVENNIVVALPTAIVAVIGDFYSPCIPSNDLYELLSVTGGDPALILNNVHTPECSFC